MIPFAWQSKNLFLYTMCSVGTYKYSFTEENLESIRAAKTGTFSSFFFYKENRHLIYTCIFGHSCFAEFHSAL